VKTGVSFWDDRIEYKLMLDIRINSNDADFFPFRVVLQAPPAVA
jgi:hypothetical protein